MMKESSDQLIKQAEEHLGRGDRVSAAGFLARAMQQDSLNDELPALAALIHFELGDMPKAASMALKALAIRPFHPAAMNLLGVACLDGGDAEMARRILHRAVTMAPGFRKAKQNLRQARRTRPAGKTEGGRGLPLAEIKKLLSTRKAGLTACIVARENFENLPDCIASLEGVADQLILLDATGGKAAALVGDKAVEIHQFEWRGDRSAALNSAMRNASEEWLLMLEPDEWLEPTSKPALIEALADRRAICHAVELRESGDGTCHFDLRLMRNAPGLRYRGSVHPRLQPSLNELAQKWKLGAGQPGITIESVSFRPEEDFSQSETELADRLSQEDLRREPDNRFMQLQRARVELEMNSALPALERLRNIDRTKRAESRRLVEMEQEELATLEGSCLLRLERYEELAGLMRAYHDSHSPTRNTLFLEGVAMRAMGDPAGAETALRSSVDLLAQPTFLPPFPELLGTGLQNMLGAALTDQKRFDEAGIAFEEALARQPLNLEARLGLLGVMLTSGEIDKLLAEMDSLAKEHGDDPRIWSIGGSILGKVPQLLPVAEQWLQEGIRRFPDNDDLRTRLGEIRLLAGRSAEALEAWGEKPHSSSLELAARFTASLCSGEELPDVEHASQDAVEQGVVAWLESLMACSAYEALDRALLEIERAGDKLPGLPDRTAGWLDSIGQDEAAARIRHSGTENVRDGQEVASI